MDLDVGVISEVEKKQKKKLLLDYLYDNLKNHNWWAYRYFFCELLAFLNIIGKFGLGCCWIYTENGIVEIQSSDNICCINWI